MERRTLRQYRAILAEINDLEKEKQLILDRYLAPASLSGMPSLHNNGDKIGNVVARREKYQRLIDKKLDELIELREQIEKAIEDLSADDRRIMRLYYIDGKSWEQVAVDLHYSIYRIWHKHGEILAKMKKDSRQ